MTFDTGPHPDPPGKRTLQVIAKADHFNEWMYDAIRPFISGRVLEIGSGIGNMSEAIMRSADTVYLSDVNENYVAVLKNRFSGRKNPVEIFILDLVDPAFDLRFAALFGTFDTILALNVIEHIENDALAVSNCHKLLRPGGSVVILVPAFPALYNPFDKELCHYRRYTRRQLMALVSSRFQVVHSSYFNFAGIFGWFISGAVLRFKIIPSFQFRFFNRLVPVFRLLDAVMFRVAGLSVVVVGNAMKANCSDEGTVSSK